MVTQPQGATQSPPVEASRRWLFANAILDERTFELQVKGQEVEIERKPFEVLRFLLQHAGEVVTKDELLAGVWPGRFLSDTVLTKCIGRLREVLSDDEQTVIKTVYGYGYRFIAPVRVELQHAAEVARFDFKPGDHPNGRPMWSLIRRLGAGGHGEAWLGQHDKTHEPRVFKFAIDEPSLAALKREITLFRFLNDSLGERARIVPLLDWNLEQPPCFLESEYIAGGSLIDWAERSGGLARIPLATRIEIAAQIAEALAGVHSVGVLHKDLKPSNVLIEGQGVDIRLADFGSGGVLDPKKLEALGITRLGFTRTIALNSTAGGTLLYLAPELLAGQPTTVKADVYALGILLYQLVVGEFRKAMAPGWEHEISDEILRECIADAAQGDAERRLADAGALAQRLRMLDDERDRRKREREAKEKAEALERALEAAKASQAVADFLGNDMFAVVTDKPLRDLTVRELLLNASEKLAGRFADMPLAAATLHASLGKALLTIQDFAKAEQHLGTSLDLYQELNAAPATTLSVASQLVSTLSISGRLQPVLERYDKLVAAASLKLGAVHPAVVGLRYQLSHERLRSGHFIAACAELRELVSATKGTTDAHDASVAQVQGLFGFALRLTGAFAESIVVTDECLARLRAARGTSPMTLGYFRDIRCQSLIGLGRYQEAFQDLTEAIETTRAWSIDDGHLLVISHWMHIGQLEILRGRTEDGIKVLEAALADLLDSSSNKELDTSPELRRWLARGYLSAGRDRDAVAQLRAALIGAQRTFGLSHPWFHIVQIDLADALRRSGELAEAKALLASVDLATLRDRAGANHPFVAEWHRVEGFFAHAQGQKETG